MIDALKHLPCDWVMIPLGHLASYKKDAFVDGPFGSDLKSGEYKDEGVPLIQLNNIKVGLHILQKMKFISFEKRTQLKRHIARAGDVVIAKMADPVARAALVSKGFQEYVIVADCVKMTPNENLVESRFLVYAINSKEVNATAQLVSTGTTRIRINLTELKKLRIPYPTLPEQRAIAEFLDRETGKIDQLVLKQERLIELLKEKRQAVISHAVTKGLDPNAPMKDSGIEWLGEIPEHWVVKRLKLLLQSRKGAIKTGPFGSHLKSSDMLGSDIKIYNQRSVIDRDFSGGENYIDYEKFEELKGFEVFSNDLLITTRGTIGRCAVFPDGSDRGILHPCLMRLQLDTRIASNDYLETLIQESGKVLEQLNVLSNSTTIEVIYSESLKEVWVATPPTAEQRAISEFLDTETTKIDHLIAKAEQAIGLMKERRTALISAAVTGKIDVREVV